MNNKSLVNENKDIKDITNEKDKNENISELTNINNNNDTNDLTDINKKEENLSNTNYDTNVNINNYINKVEMLEFLIGVIKKYSYGKIKKEIISKNYQKKELETNINILSSKINNMYIQRKNFNSLSKSIQNERSHIGQNLKNNFNSLYCEDSLSNIKEEINTLINKIKEEKEELANNNISISEAKKEMHLIKNEIKLYNNSIRQLKIEKDIFFNSIRLLNKHIALAREKLEKHNDKSNDFFIALTNLAIKSKKCEMERRYTEEKNKRPKSCKRNMLKTGMV